MKFNSVLVMVAAAFSVAQCAQLHKTSNEVANIAARAPEAVAQHPGAPPYMGSGGGGGSSEGSSGSESSGSSGSSGGSSGGESSGQSGSSSNNEDCGNDDQQCNSAMGRSLPVFGGVAGLAVAMAALL